MSVLSTVESRVLEEKDRIDILSLMEVAYVPREPVCLGVHANNDDLLPFFENIVEACLASKASIGLRVKASGKLIGILLNLIVTSPDAESVKLHGYSKEKSNLYGKVVAELCFEINVLRDCGMKKQMELFILTVHPDFCRKGFATELVRLSEIKGKEMGCDVATIQASNPITEIIASKKGFKPVKQFDVSTIKNEDGKQILDLTNMNGITHFTYFVKYF